MLSNKTKVLAYIYRDLNEEREILVFDQVEFPEAGTQVIGGTVEEGEDKREALLREIIEESGLVFHIVDVFPLQTSIYFYQDRPEKHHRHYFYIEGSHLAETWIHEVDSTGADNGLHFRFYWLTLNEAKEKLAGNMFEYLDLLQSV